MESSPVEITTEDLASALVGAREEMRNRMNSDSTAENETMNEKDGHCYVSFLFLFIYFTF
jgi:hypothetical protein